jgi:peptide deformylase
MSFSIIHYPHPTLRIKSKPIRRVDQALKSLAAEMLDLMYATQGVGLAANQIDVPLRLFVVNPAGARGDGEELVLINPELQLPKGIDTAQEGCLSLPGMYGTVTRPKSIRVSAYDLSGKLIERTVDDYFARIMLHENDHLDGVLFIDRMAEMSNDFQRGIEKFERVHRQRQADGSLALDDSLVSQALSWQAKYA